MQRTAAQLQQDVQAIWQAGVNAVDSARLVQENIRVADGLLEIAEQQFVLSDIRRITVIGAGKAGAGMAAGLETALGQALLQQKQVTGLLSVPEDCVRDLQTIELAAGRPAGENSPTEQGVQITNRMLGMVDQLGPNDLCICLLSGGGSALLPAPAAGISLTEKQNITAYLSGAGANIEQLNTVRKQLSRIKGGGLLRHASGTNLVTLIISDVLGDPLDVIASGPTVPNTTTATDALAVLQQFNVLGRPEFSGIVRFLEDKAASHSSTPDSLPPSFNYVIGNNAVAVDAAGIEAESRGYSHAMICSTQMEGPAEEIGIHLASMALKMRNNDGPDCLITGGEPIVHLVEEKKRGKGGRNQQLVLAALNQFATANQSSEGIAFLSGGTDGEDGPTNAAGAWFDQTTLAEYESKQLDPAGYLTLNDAYHFFQPLNRLIITGPTHTNVCDIRVIVVDRVQTPVE
ncbi:MAG: glycerate kinase [Blastopirellula sp.]|nr:MAG: glycerate kinase [Blastopirellula sp.]